MYLVVDILTLPMPKLFFSINPCLSFMQQHLPNFFFLVLVLQNDEYLYQITKNIWGITAEPRKTYLKSEKTRKTVNQPKTGKTLNGHNSRTIKKNLKKFHS